MSYVHKFLVSSSGIYSTSIVNDNSLDPTHITFPLVTTEINKYDQCFLDILYTSFTFIHSNLEHGLAILTESFSPVKSE